MREFTAYVNPKFEFYRHCEVLIDALEKVVSGEIKRLIIQMPPRHGKSELVSRILPSYFLCRYPNQFVCVASYSFELAGTLSRNARENYLGAGGRIKEEAGAIKHWETTAGGGCWAVGTGGSATGKGFALGIIDDPTKGDEDASSLAMRDKNYEWFRSVFYTRAEPDAAIICVTTRWHEDDLIGRLIAAERHSSSREDWHIISLPALYEPDHADLFPVTCTIEPDFRSREGEALCPERYPENLLKHKKAQIGDYHFGALYQQRPTAASGVLFDISKIEFIDHAPVEVFSRCRAWDKAATEGGGDWTVGVKMSKTKDGHFIIEHVERGQWGSAKRDSMIKMMAELDGKKVRIIGEQEPGSAGVDSARGFTKLLGGYQVSTETASGSKEIRADAFSSQLNAGNVRVVRGEWNAAYIEELRQFPRGRHDDQVDASSLAFNSLAKYQPWVISTRRIY